MSLSDELCRSYLDLRWHFDPAAATLAGFHELDGRLGEFDLEAVRTHLAAFRAIEAGVEELAVEDAADEIDRTALLDDIRVTIFRLQHERPHRRNPAFWLLHLAEALYALRAEGAPGGEMAAAALSRLKAIPAFLTSAEETIQEPPAAFLEIARELFAPLDHLVGRLLHDFGPAVPGDRAAFSTAAAAAHEALQRFRGALDTELAVHADEHAFAAGDEHFDLLLHHQHAVTAGAPELWRVVIRLEEEIEAELRSLAAQLEHAGDWRDLLQQQVASVRPWQDPGPEAVRELRRIDAFVREKDLVGAVLDGLEIEPLPDFLAPVTCHGSYLPAPLQGEGAGRLWLRDSRFTQAFLSPLLAEAGVPGVHLQARRSARLPSAVRAQLGSNLTRWGWGLYAVDLLEAEGFWTTPDEQLLARSHQLLRVLLARIDIGLHTRQMTIAEATGLLQDRLPFEPEHALAAVRGCCLEPTQAVGAVIGRRALHQLREERQQKTRGLLSKKGFHDEVLAFGMLPVPLIRWGMGLE